MQQLTVQDKAARRLLALDPPETDKALAESLRQRTGLSVVSKVKNTFHDNGTVTTERSASYVTGTATADEVRRSISDYELAMTPAPASEVVKLVSALKVTTASRNSDSYDTELMLEAYSRGLSKFPADVVVCVLKRMRKWFPTLMELSTECEELASERVEVLRSLNSKLIMIESGYTPKPPQAKIISADERARVEKLMDGLSSAIGKPDEYKAAPRFSLDQELIAIRDRPLEVSDYFKRVLREQIKEDAILREMREAIAQENPGASTSGSASNTKAERAA